MYVGKFGKAHQILKYENFTGNRFSLMMSDSQYNVFLGFSYLRSGVTEKLNRGINPLL